MSQYTPTPWKVATDNQPFEVAIVAPWSEAVRPGNTPLYGDYRGGIVCKMEWNSGVPTENQAAGNAAFIVRACNSHDELVKALEQAVRSMYLGMDLKRTADECLAALALAKEA